MKLLVKTRRGVHIREKSAESAENIEEVHPNKIRSWLALAEASYNAAGGTMEDIIASVIDEMKGFSFKADKQPLPVTEEEYQELLLQAAKKGVSKAMVDALVVVVAKKKPDIEKLIEKTLMEIKIP